MKKIKSDIFNTIRYSYLTVFVLIMIALVVITVKSSIDVMNNRTKRAKNDFYSFYDTAESKIDMYQRISGLLFDNKDVINFVRNEDASVNLYQYIVIGKKIKSYRDIFYDINSNIVLYDLERRICIRDGGSMEYEDLYANLNLTDEKLLKFSDKESFCIISKHNNMVTFVFKRGYYDTNRMLYCFITTDIGSLIPSSGMKIILNKKSTELQKKQNITDRKIVLTKNSELIPEICYWYSVNDNNVFFVAFMTFLDLICLLCMLFSRKITEKILNLTYKPIIENFLLSSKSKNESIRWDESVKSLIYEMQLLNTNIKRNKIVEKKMFLYNLLYNNDGSQMKKSAEYGFRKTEVSHRVILIYCSYKQYEEDTSDFESSMERLLTSCLEGDMISIGTGKYAFVTNECDADVLRKKLVNVLDFTELYEMEILICVGKIVDKLEKISISYIDALDCAERKSMFPEKSIVFSEEFPEENAYYYSLDSEIELIDNVLSGNKRKAKEILNSLFERGKHNVFIEGKHLTELKIMMVATMNRILNKMNKTMRDSFYKENPLYLSIAECNTKDELIQTINNLFEALCSYNEKNVQTKQEQMSKEIVKFIEENYGDHEFSLEKAARAFCISQNHVSRVLKNSIGKSYKDYLNYVRIEKAKDLLVNTQMTISAIADNVGYNDNTAFIRIFKKYTQYTPNEYRINHRE